MDVREKGFTLIELLIVVVILGILAAIAFPSYQQYVLEGRRTEGQTALMRVAAMQEQYFMDNKVYTTDLTNLGFNAAAFLTDNGFYSISSACDAAGCVAGFVLTATPQGVQSSDGNLTFNHLGVKTPSAKW